MRRPSDSHLFTLYRCLVKMAGALRPPCVGTLAWRGHRRSEGCQHPASATQVSFPIQLPGEQGADSIDKAMTGWFSAETLTAVGPVTFRAETTKANLFRLAFSAISLCLQLQPVHSSVPAYPRASPNAGQNRHPSHVRRHLGRHNRSAQSETSLSAPRRLLGPSQPHSR